MSVKPRAEAVLSRAKLGRNVGMGVGTSLFLVALGAVLKYAVRASPHAFNIHTVGLILILVGTAGLLISLLSMQALSRRRERVMRYDERIPPRLR